MNSHPGHKQYMKMVQDRKLEYVSCKNSAKIKVSNGLSCFLWKGSAPGLPCLKATWLTLIFLVFKLFQIALRIVKDLRSLDPPARFLQKDRSTGLWNDVGDKKVQG